PPRLAAALMKPVTDAVAYAHANGVIHRDLKPGNVLLDAAAGQPRVTDFGLAKRADTDSSLTQAGQVMGTPSYMSPEQAEGKNEQVGPLADVYSLGATLYCLITGRPPFQSASVVDTLKQVVDRDPVAPRSLNPAVDRDLDTIVLKCLQKKPEQRYGSAVALGADLQRYLDRRAIHARPVGDVEKLLRWCRRNPLVAGSLAGVATILVMAFFLVSWSYVRAEKARQVGEQREKDERWERYRANMIAAGSAMQLHNVGAVQSALDTAPEEHRNWEWRYFHHQLDTAQQVVRIGDDIQSVGISPDGTFAAVQYVSGAVRLWNLRTGARHEIALFPDRSPEIWFRFSADSKLLAHNLPQNNTIVIWDIALGRERAVLSGAEKAVKTAQFSPDGTRLSAGSDDRMAYVWDTSTGNRLAVLHGHESPLNTAEFSPDGRRIVTAGWLDRTVRLWDAETGKSQEILRGHNTPVLQAIFNPQGDRVLSVEDYPGNVLRLWDAGSGKLVQEMPGHTNKVDHLAFSPDGSRIASSGLDRMVRLWDGRTGKAVASREGHRGPVSSVAFSPDGKYLFTAAKDQTVRLWDAATGDPLGVLHGHTGAIDDATYSADGKTIVTLSMVDGAARLWNAQSALQNGVLRGHEKFVYGVAFHPDGERVASAAWDGTVRIWDATTGSKISVLSYPPTTTLSPTENAIVSSVAFHPAGKLVAAFVRDATVRGWDLATEKEAFCFRLPPGHYGVDPRVAFSPRGNLLAASGGSNNSVHVWDVERRAEIEVLHGHRGAVVDVCFSPDDSWLASASSDRTIRIWNLRSMEQVQVLEGHISEIQTVAVSRDGRWLASGSLDGMVRVWNTTTWKEAAAPLKHGTSVYGVAFTPDGTRLACACANNMIRFWDVKTFQMVAELEGHGAYVHQIAFSPDGSRLVSASGDFTVRIWDSLSVQERAKQSAAK
ncbi:MAG: WD40 repeat domain-containing serine/threonine protein kinase, partial [Gemmataceae bacterium]